MQSRFGEQVLCISVLARPSLAKCSKDAELKLNNHNETIARGVFCSSPTRDLFPSGLGSFCRPIWQKGLTQTNTALMVFLSGVFRRNNLYNKGLFFVKRKISQMCISRPLPPVCFRPEIHGSGDCFFTLPSVIPDSTREAFHLYDFFQLLII